MIDKHLIVDENTHRKAKAQAAMRGLSIRKYLEKLLDQDKKAINKALKG